MAYVTKKSEKVASECRHAESVLKQHILDVKDSWERRAEERRQFVERYKKEHPVLFRIFGVEGIPSRGAGFVSDPDDYLEQVERVTTMEGLEKDLHRLTLIRKMAEDHPGFEVRLSHEEYDLIRRWS